MEASPSQGATPMASPNQDVTFTIYVNGAEIPNWIPVFGLDVVTETGKAATARIQILDGSPSEPPRISESDFFTTGNLITIKAGYDNHNETLFEGTIFSQSLADKPESGPMLSVDCREISANKQITSTPETPLQLFYGSDIQQMNLCCHATGTISGSVHFQGNILATPQAAVQLTKINKRYDGFYVITGAIHSIRDCAWTTEATISNGKP